MSSSQVETAWPFILKVMEQVPNIIVHNNTRCDNYEKAILELQRHKKIILDDRDKLQEAFRSEVELNKKLIVKNRELDTRLSELVAKNVALGETREKQKNMINNLNNALDQMYRNCNIASAMLTAYTKRQEFLKIRKRKTFEAVTVGCGKTIHKKKRSQIVRVKPRKLTTEEEKAGQGVGQFYARIKERDGGVLYGWVGPNDSSCENLEGFRLRIGMKISKDGVYTNFVRWPADRVYMDVADKQNVYFDCRDEPFKTLCLEAATHAASSDIYNPTAIYGKLGTKWIVSPKSSVVTTDCGLTIKIKLDGQSSGIRQIRRRFVRFNH